MLHLTIQNLTFLFLIQAQLDPNQISPSNPDMFNKGDFQQFRDKGILPAQIEEQLAEFRQGKPYVALVEPCKVGKGILRLSPSEVEHYAQAFYEPSASGRVTKFIPASGAASRMFKPLLTHWKGPPGTASEPSNTTVPSASDQKACQIFFQHCHSFAFHQDLEVELEKQGFQLSDLLRDGEKHMILRSLLFSPGLNYAQLPKGLILFHRYPGHNRTPLQEHVVEGLDYAKDIHHILRLHFTVSPAHQHLFEQQISTTRPYYEQRSVFLDVRFSQQHSSTDTLAVDLHNRPFRERHGALVFRPGGHGSLLENLSSLEGDIVFIKNIDNVAHERFNHITTQYKRALGGMLVDIQDKVFFYLRLLKRDDLTPEHCRIMTTFIEEVLNRSVPVDFSRWPQTDMKDYFFQMFNRPLRVCGMVPNTGEPGGGPFWVRFPDESLSPQIVEASQVDPDSLEQQTIFKSATHFNPVDLVCGLRDFQGNPFNLPLFADRDSGTISQKFHEGRVLKALELPGLWNGAMALWNTIFVEVPQVTFNPVKTIIDLLRPEHQPDTEIQG